MLPYKCIPLIPKFLLNDSDFHIILDILDRKTKKTRPPSAGTRFLFRIFSLAFVNF